MEIPFINGPHFIYVASSYGFALGALLTLTVFSTFCYLGYKKQLNKKKS